MLAAHSGPRNLVYVFEEVYCMLFDYSCCDLCPYDVENSTYNGTVCENCQAKAAERRLFSMMADMVVSGDEV